jgi:RNA polymerase primary sigma factor
MATRKLARHDLHYNPTELYWRDIKDAEPLSREQEVALFTRAHQGDEQARQELVLANLRFVVSVAHEYKDYGLSLIELISEGNIGLLEAIRRFDETRGFKFITYAVWWIRQAILKALGEHGKAARPPMSQINDLIKVEKEAGVLTQVLGRVPTCDEIATHAGISAERVQTALEVGQQVLSLDAPVYDNEKNSLVSVLQIEQEGVDEWFEKSEMERALHECLAVLDGREYQILRAYFGLDGAEPQTMEEIGELMGITRERVRQLRNRALEKLRHRGGEVLAAFSEN